MKDQLRLYNAGPMRGYDEFNFPAFREAAAWLRAQGHTVLCPAERDEAEGFDASKNSLDGFDMHEAMKADLNFVINNADGISLLPGFEDSSGAKLELASAIATGKRIFLYNPALLGDKRFIEVTGTLDVEMKVTNV